jgi:glycosyltransferase involved in cell wall biosynthesis
MAALFRSVDVAVLPSYREGVPRGLIEAGACGLPLVTTDAPGCRDVVVDGVNGFLVPVRDAGALPKQSLGFRMIRILGSGWAGLPGRRLSRSSTSAS